MAWQSGNRWYPDRYTIGNRKLLLSPDKTPMENLWWLIDICCGVWLAKYRVYAYSREAVEELEQELRMRTFLRFRDHVWRKTYRTDLSLYLNVRSAAWGVCSNVIKLWRDKNILAPSLTLDIDRPIDNPNRGPSDAAMTLGETFASHLVPKLWTVSDGKLQSAYKQGKRHSLDEVSRGAKDYHQVWTAITEEQYDYYLQSCDEYGLAPLSHDDFIAKNFPPPGLTKAEKAIRQAKAKLIDQQKKDR